MKQIQILGGGCRNCEVLESETRKAAQMLGWHEGSDFTIEKVKDFAQIAALGVMSTPGLVVDGVVKSSGKVLAAGDVIKHLQ
jgi:small redox-active disulfide protein 2